MNINECTTCNGRREIGGFIGSIGSGAEGYQTDPCPDCQAPSVFKVTCHKTNHEIAVEAKQLELEAINAGDKKLAFRLAVLAQKAIRADCEPQFYTHSRSESMNIITNGNLRRWGWTAVYEDYDGAEDSHCPCGVGDTEQEAIDDLIWKSEVIGTKGS